MELLVLGGTKFLGPHLVESARARGHQVTLFNRGKSGRAPADVEWIAGDRDGELGKLGQRRWDAVIDTCGFVPRVVKASVDALRERAGRYVFVSTISVYPESFGGSFDESEPLIALEDQSVETVTPQTYGGLKALCEARVSAGFGDRALIVRPGLIVGPLDPTDRFTYWPNRFALGGEILAPAPSEAFVSFIDVRDLADWIVAALDGGVAGIFNASGRYGAITMGDMLAACAAAASTGVPLWVSEAFLLANGVTPWTELPLWIPQGEDSIVKASSARAVEAGLRCRPLADTVAATLEWSRGLGLDRPLRAGLTREREAQLLAAWRASAKTTT
ncbi:MAG TPA: NAD-dependent epimerase/dehydratase family protein [Candidatus Eremiobacteraceae bacterium]|nr:NAD-dependent epimerase/dehydratase family protein [Candidatus Eremiobacteraceae bacterium]